MRLDPDAPTAKLRREKRALVDYHDFRIPDEADETYAIIAGHRNPYDRLWSHWKHRNRRGNPAVFKSISWLRYVKWACDPGSVPEITGANLELPICELLNYDRVSHWLRFESLATSWRELSDRLDIPLPALDRLNRSVVLGTYRDAYDSDIAGMVADRFAADFETFHYSLDSWRSLESGSISVQSLGAARLPTSSKQQPEGRLRRRVAVLTTFAKSRPAYSLNRVVQDQLVMLIKHGYKPKVIVLQSPYWADPEYPYSDPNVEIIQLPRVERVQDSESESQTEADIEKLVEAFEPVLSDVDVVLTHDLIYQGASVKLMVAARRAADRCPNVVWLQWIHSATSPRLLGRTDMENSVHSELRECGWPASYPVCFNKMSVARIAENFGYEESDVKIVPHAIDVCRFFGLSPHARRLYEEKSLYLADYITLCPARLDRGKQIEWVIKIMARLKSGRDLVRMIVMDFHSQDEDKRNYRNELKTIAGEWGLNGDDLVFLSEFDDDLKLEAPHSLVRELFCLSNVYINPSRSESYSLSAQEAALTGNLLVLNADFPPMREIYGEDALYFQFSSNVDRNTLMDGDTFIEYQDVEFDALPIDIPRALVNRCGDKWIVRGDVAYADLIAKKIRYQFRSNPVLSQRRARMRDRNLYAVFRNHLEPILYL